MTQTDKQAKHAPEPWGIEDYQSNGNYSILCNFQGRGRSQVAVSSNQPNARRIVAAVNACQDISTEALESGIIDELVEAASDLAHLPFDTQAFVKIRQVLAKVRAP